MRIPRLGRAATLAASLAFAEGCAGAQVDAKPPPADDGPPTLAADGTYTVAGVRYVEFVTGGATADQALPLVVALHGNNGNPSNFKRHFEGLPVKARVVVPFGWETTAKGFAWSPAMGPMSDGELASRLPAIVGRVIAFIGGVERGRPTVGKPVLVGFSQGAYLSYALAATHGDHFSAACPFAGMIPETMILEAAALPKGVAVHGFHGSEDALVPPGKGQHTVELLKKAGFSADFTELPGIGHDFKSAAPEVLKCVEDGVAKAPGGPSAMIDERRRRDADDGPT